ncbi:MAG: hypothetical protein EHM63_06195, partial [Actinobacteria bacterium]
MRFDSDFERVMALPAPSRLEEAVADAPRPLDPPIEQALLRIATVEQIDQTVDETFGEIEEETKRLIWLTERVSDGDDPLAAADLNAAERLRHAEATAAALLEEARRKADALFAEGVKLRDSNLELACAKFGASLQLNPQAIGVLLNVAMCDEKHGR